MISPLLANIFLHEVLDEWWIRNVQPRLKGRSMLVRYADDFVMLFELEHDAQRVTDVLAKRFAKYGLTLHPEKTRLLSFTPPPKDGEDDESGSFDFLGFTHYWAKSRKGRWMVARKTSKKRFTRGLTQLREWLRQHLHAPIPEQWKQLCQKLTGHAAYYGIRGNWQAIARFYRQAWFAWKVALDRRSNSCRYNAAKHVALTRRYPLPKPRLRAQAPT